MRLFKSVKWGLAAVLVGTTIVSATVIPGVVRAVDVPCNSGGAPSITKMDASKFYIDPADNFYANYAAYRVTAGASALTGVSLTLGSFTGGVISLATNQPGTLFIGNIPATTSKTVYFLLRASALSAVAQGHVATLQNASDSSAICMKNFSYTGVYDTIKASANKVNSTSITSPPAPAAVGDSHVVTINGDTGTIGAGPGDDPGVFVVNATTSSSFPANAWRLDKVELDISLNGVATSATYTDDLYFTNTSGSNRAYVVRYYFKAAAPQATTSTVAAVQYIASGTQVKHTTVNPATVGALPIISSAASVILTKTAVPTTLPAEGGVITYTVTLTNSKSFAVTIDSIVDTISGPATYSLGTSQLNAVSIENPSNAANVLTWVGPLSVPANGTIVLTYAVTYPSGDAAYSNSVVAHAGNSTFDADSNTSSSSPATASITVGAAPNVTVTFNSNYGTPTTSTQTTNVATALMSNGFTRSGYSFAGWNTVAGGGGTSYTDGQSYPFVVGVTLYAQWAAPNVTVTFDINGGDGGATADQTTNVATNLRSNGFTRSGYSFTGWNTVAGGSGTSYTDGQSYPFTASVTLYAQWTIANVTVTFDTNGGTGGATANQTTNVATNLRSNGFTRSGYNFAGWNTVAGGSGTAYTDGQSYPFTASVTLYAQWTLQFTIDGGRQTVPAGQSGDLILTGVPEGAVVTFPDNVANATSVTYVNGLVHVIPVAGFSGRIRVLVTVSLGSAMATTEVILVVLPKPAPRASWTNLKRTTTINWTASLTPTVTSYVVTVNGRVVCEVNAPQLSCEVSGPLSSATRVRIRAIGGDSTESSLTAGTPPGRTCALLGTVYFATSSAVLDASEKTKLQELAKIINTQKFSVGCLTGHTDSRGSISYNNDLSQLRLLSVYQYLAARVQLPKLQYLLDFRGKLQPVAPNNSATGMALNRRVDIYIGG